MQLRFRFPVLPGVLAALLAFALLAPTSAHTDPPEEPPRGSPAAKASPDGHYLPNPPPPFGGKIGLSAGDSKPYWNPQIAPPKGAPNVLLILTDDAGYGVSSTFGGVIPTPTMDRLASRGLRYTQMHSTALCSPSRAALITGRNHHSVGFGVISEQATGFPGYDSEIGLNNASVGEILKLNGYSTSWFGKNHNTPAYQYSAAGPFDQWPIGMGFEYFYGFMGGETDQWTPYLFRNTTQIYPWRDQPGYNLVTGMADDAITHLRQLNASAPEKPFFCYYAPGATHAPHHPTREWVEKFRGKFDMGWNVLRDQIFANQKRLGVIPPDTELTPWPDSLPKWDTLSDMEKKVFARQVEVYAAYAAYTDHEIGRVIQAVEDMGKLDDTLIIYITGDNGTSAEGTTLGTPFELAAIQNIPVPVVDQVPFLEVWGSDVTAPHMSVAWSWALDTPFKWTKQVASHFGGTRQGMCISWPRRIQDMGGIRNQFHHFIDVVPTILEAAGLPAPAMVNGIAQSPIEGVSMAYTWQKEAADAPSRRETQYFEMFGNRGIYHDGWYACTTPPEPPWLMGTKPMPEVVDGYAWELYHIAEDFSQNRDLAKSMPERLARMKELFFVEAARYQVLPLDNSILPRIVAKRPSYTAGRTKFRYDGELVGIPMSDAPHLLGCSYTISADIEVPAKANGMICTLGGRFGGYGLYLLEGKPVFLYNLLALAKFRWEGPEALPAGKHRLVFEFEAESGELGAGGAGTFTVDGKSVGVQKLPHTPPVLMTIDETFDVGVDTRSGVEDKDYQVPFRFSGKIVDLTIEVRPAPSRK